MLNFISINLSLWLRAFKFRIILLPVVPVITVVSACKGGKVIDEIPVLWVIIYIFFSASGVWLTADDFDCGESKACSGCCYRYPPAMSSVRTQEADLQLSCSKFFLASMVPKSREVFFVFVFLFFFFGGGNRGTYIEVKKLGIREESSWNKHIIIVVAVITCKFCNYRRNWLLSTARC